MKHLNQILFGLKIGTSDIGRFTQNSQNLVGMAHELANSANFGLLGEPSSHKWDIPCLGRLCTAAKNVTPLALSLVKKPVTVQTHTHKITNQQ